MTYSKGSVRNLDCDCGKLVEVAVGQKLRIPSGRRGLPGGHKNEQAEVVGFGQDQRSVRVRWPGRSTLNTIAISWFHESDEHTEYERQEPRAEGRG